jgi:hypothetical protein
MPVLQTINPTALSGTNDGTTLTANGATMVLGYTAAATAAVGGMQANLRYDTHNVAAAFNGSDLATSTPWTSITSASHLFTAADVGQTIYIISGTNFTIGSYKITAVSVAGAATVAACGSTGASTGGVWFLSPFNANYVVSTQFLATVSAVGATGSPHTADLAAATATTVPVVSSATYTFIASDVGNTITVSAGTSWITGTYTIISVAAGAATLNKACGSIASLTAGTWTEGTLLGLNHAVGLWGANYRSAIGAGEYNVAANNLATEYRFSVSPNNYPLVPAFSTVTFNAAKVSATDAVYAAAYVVPSRLLNAGNANLNANNNIFPQIFVGSDLASAGTPWLAVTSAGHVFTQSDVGQPLNILAGTTNFTTGIYTIVSVSAGAATLDRACGSVGAATGGIYVVSGVCDLELRPVVAGSYASLQVADTVTVQGPASATIYSTGTYSGLSYKPILQVTTITPAEMASGQSPYRKQAIGAESYFAYDIEPNEGYAVVGQNILDVDADGLTQQAANLFGASLSNERARPRKVAIGRTGAGGNVSFELTPERWTKLLTGLMKITSILDSNGNELGNATTFAGPFTGTDLASANGTAFQPTVTSATRNFTVADIDEVIVITAGTSWTTGTYTIVNVLNNGAILNKACGSVAALTAGTWIEGAAIPGTANTMISYATVAANIALFASTGPYTYQFRTCQSNQVASFTGIVKKGSFRKVYPGLKVSSMSFSVGLDNLVHSTVDFAGLDEFTYDQTCYGIAGDEIVLSTTAGYDTITNSVWSYVDGICALGGITDAFTQATTINLSQDLRERRGLNGKRGPVSHFPLGFSASTNMTIYSENEVHLKNFLGVQYQGYPFKPGKVINFDSYSMTFGRQDIPDLLQFYMPKTMFVTLADPIQGEDVIMMSGDMIGIYDYSNWNSSIVITLTTQETPTSFFPSTNYITVYPPDSTGIQTQGNLSYLPVNPTSPIIDPYAPGGAGSGAGSGTIGSGYGPVTGSIGPM